jgi:hypothetical protein
VLLRLPGTWLYSENNSTSELTQGPPLGALRFLLRSRPSWDRPPGLSIRAKLVCFFCPTPLRGAAFQAPMPPSSRAFFQSSRALFTTAPLVA